MGVCRGRKVSATLPSITHKSFTNIRVRNLHNEICKRLGNTFNTSFITLKITKTGPNSVSYDYSNLLAPFRQVARETFKSTEIASFEQESYGSSKASSVHSYESTKSTVPSITELDENESDINNELAESINSKEESYLGKEADSLLEAESNELQEVMLHTAKDSVEDSLESPLEKQCIMLPNDVMMQASQKLYKVAPQDSADDLSLEPLSNALAETTKAAFVTRVSMEEAVKNENEVNSTDDGILK